MESNEIYLDTYVLQRDMRIRLPKAVLSNLQADKGKTKFDIYLNSNDKSLVLRIHKSEGDTSDE